LYAIIRDRSRQTRVHTGDRVLCDLRTDVAPGDSITFDEVLAVGDEGTVKIGKPTVAGASVKAEVIGLVKGEKLIAFRFKRRKGVRRKRGHRQKYTCVRIGEITAGETA
jgi:large subunit ribosomal protein L21